LTAENIKAAQAEIKTGERVQLDWSLDNVQFPGFGRIPLEYKRIDLGFINFVGNDDEVHFSQKATLPFHVTPAD
jgi:hypothetical protein